MIEEYLLEQDRQLETREQTVPFEDYLKLEEKCDELKCEVQSWKEKYENEVQYREDNFERVSEMSMYGLREADFH